MTAVPYSEQNRRDYMLLKNAAKRLDVTPQFLLGMALEAGKDGLRVVKTEGKTGGTVWMIHREDVARLRSALA